MRRILLAATTLLVLTVVLLDLGARWRLSASIVVPARAIRANPVAVERGRHLGESVLVCTECHGADLGGAFIADAPGFGQIVGPNLTSGSGGVTKTMRDADWDRVIRHGVAPDGRPLILMPSDGYAALSDADLAALRAWVEQVQPVDRILPYTSLGFVGRALAMAGKIHVAAWTLDHDSRVDGSEQVTVSDGEQLARISGCFGCHGEDLTGRTVQPGRPPAPSLVSGRVTQWTEVEFATAVRAGRRPDGAEIDPLMPWRGFSGMSDAEVHMIWSFLLERRNMDTVQP